MDRVIVGMPGCAPSGWIAEARVSQLRRDM